MVEEKEHKGIEALYKAVCHLRIYWSDVIVRNIHYAIILVSAIWGLLGKGYIDSLNKPCCGNGFGPWYIFCAALLSSIVILLWRWYSHHLDKQITHLYPDLVFYEAELGTADDEGTWGYLKKDLFKNTDTSKLCAQQRKSLIKKLVEHRLVGSRGHNTFDALTFVLIVLMWIACILVSQHCQMGVWSIIGLFSSVGFLGLIFRIYFQKNPTDEDIKNIISDVKKAPNKTSRAGNHPVNNPQ